MADKESTVLLRYTTDQASLRQTEAASKKLFTSLSTPKTVQSLKATNREVDELKKSLSQTEQQAKDTARAIGGIDAQAKFDEVSRRVALAGDVQSNLGALSGLAGAAGAGGLGQGIGVAGELVVLTEELPRLKAALQGMPAAAQSAISALGAGGIGLVGALAVLGVAIAAAGKIAGDARKEFDALLDAQKNYFELLVDGTTGTLQEQEADLQRRLDIQRQLTAQLEEQYQRLQNETGAVGDVFEHLSFTAAGGLFKGAEAFDSLRSDLNEATTESERLENELKNIQRAMESSEVALNDAAEAEQERVRVLQSSAEQVRQSVLQEQQFLGMSTDALNQRVQQLQNEIAANEAAAEVLRQGGQDASQYKQAIADLNRQIEFIKTTATPAARAVESLAKAEERRTKAAEDAKRIQEEIKTLDTQARQQSQQAAEEYAKRQVDLAKKQAQGELDAQKDLQRRLTDAQTELARDQANAVLQAQRDTLQAQFDFQRGEAEAARKHADSLEDIRIQAQRDERRSILDRNFKAIFEQRIQTRERIQDEQRGFSRERREAITAFQEQAEDRNRAFADERMDRLRQYEQARSDIQLDNQRRLSDLRANLMQERIELQAAYVAQLTDLKAFLAAETAAKKLALQQQFSLTKGGSKTTPLSKGNNQPLPKVSSVNNQSNQQSINVTINESGNPQKTLKAVKQAITA